MHMLRGIETSTILVGIHMLLFGLFSKIEGDIKPKIAIKYKCQWLYKSSVTSCSNKSHYLDFLQAELKILNAQLRQ